MKENESALYSHYIIDGVRCDMSPAELLDECMEYSEACGQSHEDLDRFADIVDESTEPPLSSFQFDKGKMQEYIALAATASCSEREFTMLYPEQFTRLQIAKSLISRLWSEGHFRLGDLRIWAQWEWNTRPIGSMAAFYTSADAASEYLYGLGVRMSDYVFIEGDDKCSAKFFAWLPETDYTRDEEELVSEVPVTDQDIMFKSSPYESRHPWISEHRRCSLTLIPDPDSWVIYIPFDTCSYRLGGSLLSQACGHNGGIAPHIQDPDYFIDCYEVVRELVEDGIVIAGASAGDGGLAAAASRMCLSAGLKMDISGIMSSYQEADPGKVLFGEIPGVILQIRDTDYDYLDSQLILQDIAYYPLGHPVPDKAGLTVSTSGRNSVADILATLMGQASEGED